MAFYNETNPGNHFYSESNFVPATLAPASTPSVSSTTKKTPAVVEELPQLAPSPYTKDTWSSSNVGGGGTLAEQRRQAAAEKADPKSWVNQTPEQKAVFFSNNPTMLGFQTGITNLMSPFADPKTLAETKGIIERANQIIDAKNMGPPISAMNPVGYTPPPKFDPTVGYDMDTPVGALPVVANLESGQVGALPAGGAYVGAPVGDSDVGRSAPGSAHVDSGPAPTNNDRDGGWGSRDAGGGDAKGGYIKDRPTLEDMLHYIMMRAK